MVDRDQRQTGAPGDALGDSEADQQGTDQPGPAGHADVLDLLERDTSLVERLAYDRRDELEMTPRGDLRHHAAESRVQLGL
jgi:hypothetical protein